MNDFDNNLPGQAGKMNRYGGGAGRRQRRGNCQGINCRMGMRQRCGLAGANEKNNDSGVMSSRRGKGKNRQ